MTLPTLEQVTRAKAALRFAHEDFLIAGHCANMVHVESGIIQLKAAVAILGYELVEKASPKPANVVAIDPSRKVGIFIVAGRELDEGYVAR